MATFRTAKGRPDIALSGQYPIRPWTIANTGRWNNSSNVTLDFNYTYTIVQIMKTFHKVLFVLAILIANCISASAIEFTVDGVRYSVNSDNTTVTVAGYPSGSKPTGDLTIPESVTYGGISYPVTSIGDEAFGSCRGLTSVTIPNSVTSIGYYAFSDCSGLTSVTIPNSVTSIGSGAFDACSGLTSIKVESGNSVYDSRENCNAIIKTATNTLISGCKNTIIPKSVTSIGKYAFQYCSGLTSVTIPNSVTSIGDRAFGGCSGLTSIKVESGNSVYDSRENCNAIIETATNTLISGCKKTIIPNSVTSIGKEAFWGCSGLTSVTIPNSVTSIGDWAFYGCFGLTSITIPNSVTSIGENAFSGCSGLTSVTIPKSITSIGYYAFSGCSGLTSVTIPNSVTSIGNFAFSGCSGLTSVTIPNSVTSIGDWAFNRCTGLTSLTIGNSVTEIGIEAFCDCRGLTRIDAYPNPEKVSTGWDAFLGVPKDGTLHVLPKYLSAYRTASQWKDFTNIKGDLRDWRDGSGAHR